MDKQLVHDINTWCTAFLNYAPNDGGSWGNHGDYVTQILLAGAVEAAERSQYLSDAVRAHIEQVFVRSGMDPDRAKREADRAGDMFETVQVFVQSGDRAFKHLQHYRDVPHHRACDPRTDPRFSEPPRHLRYQGGQEAWLCASEAEIKNAGYDQHNPRGDCPWLHRLDGPALRAPMGDAIEELWFEYGECHREGEPAWIWTEADGTRSLERWYTRGVQDEARGFDRRMERRRPGPS